MDSKERFWTGTLTDIVHAGLGRHTFRHPTEDVEGIALREQVPSNLRVVADEKSWVCIAIEEVLSRVLAQRLGEQLPAYALVHVAQLVQLRPNQLYPSGYTVHAPRLH